MNKNINVQPAGNNAVDTVEEITPSDILESLNIISGAHSAVFWTTFFGTTESMDIAKAVYGHINLLHDNGLNNAAIDFIKICYGMIFLDFPEAFGLIGKGQAEYQEAFIHEVLLDAEDILSDFEDTYIEE